MAVTSTATATWNGVLKSGNGTFEAASGTFQGDYTFATRFEGAQGTNPEELIAAAHAACLSMALSAGLEKAGTPPTRVTTKASCTMDMVDGAPKISKTRRSRATWRSSWTPRWRRELGAHSPAHSPGGERGRHHVE
jgi:osmotically inducible protein OsmC